MKKILNFNLFFTLTLLNNFSNDHFTELLIIIFLNIWLNKIINFLNKKNKLFEIEKKNNFIKL